MTSTQEPIAHHVLVHTIRPGIYGLLKSLSEEYSSEGIRVNCVTPRGIMVDFADETRSSVRPKNSLPRMEGQDLTHLLLILSEYIVKRFADPEEFGRVVAFAPFVAAGYITGEVVDVDGRGSKHAF